MNTLLDTSSLYAIVVQMAPDTPVSSERGNGEDMARPAARTQGEGGTTPQDPLSDRRSC